MIEMLFGLQKESVDKLEPILIGEASAMAARYFGDIHARIGDREVIFRNIVSVQYYDDLFASEEFYPYAYMTQEKAGLFECHGSSYLKRISTDSINTGELFSNYRHFVYFDKNFFWHIVAKSCEITLST